MKNSFLFSLLILPSLPILLACQSSYLNLPERSHSENSLFLDHQFIPSNNSVIKIETEQEVFFLDEAMLALVNDKLRSNKNDTEKALVLLDHIFNEENLSLQYEGNANIIASEAFHSKTANCMSLTIMAYALAEKAGMNVYFQQVNVPEYWQRNGNYNFLTGHVNLTVNDNFSSTRRTVWGESNIQIDFDPYIAKQKFKNKKINKNTVLAMFYNNKGTDALIEGDYPVAYQYFKSAIKQDDAFSSAWGNLGILYRITDNYQAAENVYHHALNIDNKNLTILDNLAILLDLKGREVDALLISNYVHKIRNSNPYYHALLGNEALYNGLLVESEQHYKKALSLKNKEHEFYLGLAKTYYMQGHISLAIKTIRKAIRYNRVKSTNQLYVAKLNFLKNVE